LTCVRAHYRSLDFAKIGRGAPLYLNGEVEDLGPHYDAVDAVAQSIVTLLERETELLLERVDSLV
jgi:hypothetical protein